MNGKQRLLAFTIFGIYFLIATLNYFFFFQIQKQGQQWHSKVFYWFFLILVSNIFSGDCYYTFCFVVELHVIRHYMKHFSELLFKVQIDFHSLLKFDTSHPASSDINKIYDYLLLIVYRSFTMMVSRSDWSSRITGSITRVGRKDYLDLDHRPFNSLSYH